MMSHRQGSDRKPTWVWIAVAFALFAVLLWGVLAPDPWRLPGGQRKPVLIGEISYSVNAREWQGARGVALQALSAAETEALAALEAELDQRLAQLFAMPRDRVSLAADWYYSLPGQVIRAGGALGADVGGRLLMRLFPPESWSEEQARLAADLAASADGHLRQTGEVLLTSFHRELRDRRQDVQPDAAVPVLTIDVSDNALFEQLQHDPVLERQALALATGALSVVVARRAAQAAAARAAGRQLGAGISAACVSAGMAAWICAGGVFGVTLLSTEVVLMRLDEAQNREEFETALQAELDRIESEFGNALRAAYLGTLSREFLARQQTVKAQLRPVDLVFGVSSDDPLGYRHP